MYNQILIKRLTEKVNFFPALFGRGNIFPRPNVEELFYMVFLRWVFSKMRKEKGKNISRDGFKLLQNMEWKFIPFNVFKIWHDREGKFIQTLVFYFEMTWAGKSFRVIICYESFLLFKILFMSIWTFLIMSCQRWRIRCFIR